MPVIFRSDRDSGRHFLGEDKKALLILWDITETEEELRQLVTGEDVDSAERFGSQKRRIGHLAWRAALRSVIRDGEVGYNKSGAPLLMTKEYDNIKNGIPRQKTYLGVAHTDTMAVVLISDYPCAVDIENVGRDVKKVAKKFISGEEEKLAGASDGLFPICVWCAKEALYKYSGKRELDFIKDLRIDFYDPENNIMEGSIENGESIPINILRINDFVVTCIV